LTEPHRLALWKSRSTGRSIYTCARPGRGSQGKHGSVDDGLVKKWISNLASSLPGDSDITIVSLLGRKPNGSSEFRFYSFHGPWDDDAEREGKQSFAEWLTQHNVGRSIRVIEQPTVDKSIPDETVCQIADGITRLLDQNACVLLMDSGGCQRTGQVCEYMDFVRSGRFPK
jgi:hypothetical protein